MPLKTTFPEAREEAPGPRGRIFVASLAVAVALVWFGAEGRAGAPTTLANPAATACAGQGGTSEIRKEAAGQVGYCRLPDGRTCEEWALFRDRRCVLPAARQP